MRNTDAIQVDRSYYKARAIIDRLQGEVSRLKIENTQLKNRPEPDPLIKNGSLIVIPKKDKLQDPIKEWNSHHFILYFQDEFKKKYHEHFSMKKDDWKVYAIRIKQFRNQNEALGVGTKDNEKFKVYIDWCFAHKFNNRFIASVPLLTSIKILTEYRIESGISAQPASYDDLIGQVPKTSKAKRDELLKDAF